MSSDRPNKILGNLKRGLLFILSAPAGTGKTTLVQMLMDEFPSVVASISYTTRKPRAGEVDGIHYNFISEEEFVERINAEEFLEYVHLYGSYYGTSKAWVEERLDEGKHVILVIDTQGALKLKGVVKATSIFMAPPSFEILEDRLKRRQTESDVLMEKRLSWAKEEMLAEKQYDYTLVNEDLNVSYQVLRSILIAEEHKIR